MAKNSLPESMDLLLDTMCNTFGGVMFIAIALSLALFAGQIKRPEPPPPENEQEKLEQMQAVNQQLEQEKAQLEQEFTALQQKIRTQEKNTSPLAVEIADLESEEKKSRRELQTAEQKSRSAEAKKNHLQKHNNALEEKNHDTAREQDKQEKQNSSEQRDLEKTIAALELRLKKMPVRKLHFALQERTSRRPYFTILKNGELCRLGFSGTKSSDEVTVKRDGNTLNLFAKRGYAIDMISADNIGSVLKFDKSKIFLWVIVHPDSFKKFVTFRRMLRQLGYQVHWYVEAKPVLYLMENVEYEASF